MRKILTNFITAILLAVSSFAYAASTNECVTNIQAHIKGDEISPYLDLSYCQLNDEDLPEVVAFLNKNKNIYYAQFNNNNIHAKGAQYLSQLTGIRGLSASGNYIGDDGVVALANNNVFESLSLYGNEITDAGVVALAKNKRLSELGLGMNLISDKGAVLLAANANIQDLILSFNRVGDEGAAALANAKHLSVLDVSGNRISDAGALAFASSVRPGSLLLYIEHNNISESAINAMRQNKSIDLYAEDENEFSFDKRNVFSKQIKTHA